MLQWPTDELETSSGRCCSLLFHFNSHDFSQEIKSRSYSLTLQQLTGFISSILSVVAEQKSRGVMIMLHV